jgi:fatty-acyl-CoA synthase
VAKGKTDINFAGEYESLLEVATPQHDMRDFDENIRATTFYTTGTTGRPKGVYFSQRQLVLHTLGLGIALSSNPQQGRLHASDVYMPITPMFHVHAWGVPYLVTLLGVKQVYPGRYEPAKLLQLIQDEGVTFSHCVPTIMHMLLSDPMAEKVDLSQWKVIIGGSALSPALAQRARDLGIDVFGGYGMSETGPVLTLAQIKGSAEELNSDEALTYRCKGGRPVPMVELKIVDSDFTEQPRDGVTTGEVVVRAPWLTQGYLNDPERSEELWTNGYLHTGDIGHIDAKGYLKITDRLKDVIKSGGEWISSLELEDLALATPSVSEAAVIGVADEKWGERPLVLVVGKETEIDCSEVAARFAQAAKAGVISEWAVPERIEQVDAIPKTSVGKIDKKRLREQFG